MESKIKYSIAIPCFNEGKNIEILIEKCIKLINSSDIEVIIVDNGSTDDSFNCCNNLNIDHLSILRLDKNIGYGGGILKGLQKAKGEFIGWTHADLQTDIFDIKKAMLLSGTNKFIKGARSGRRALDCFFSFGMSIFESLLLKKFLWEINAQPTLFPKEFFLKWQNPPKDFSLDLYAYYSAKRHNLEIKRMKVLFPPRIYGASSWNNGIASKIKLIKRTISYSLELKKNSFTD